jgi:hypothetical protein
MRSVGMACSSTYGIYLIRSRRLGRVYLRYNLHADTGVNFNLFWIQKLSSLIVTSVQFYYVSTLVDNRKFLDAKESFRCYLQSSQLHNLCLIEN